MPTKSTPRDATDGELRDEYALDYRHSKPNRFAGKLKGTTVVVLQPDVAEVFRSSRAVNDLLRSAIVATGAAPSKRQRATHRAKRAD